MLRKSHPNFYHYVKKTEVQAKNGFPTKEMLFIYKLKMKLVLILNYSLFNLLSLLLIE